MIQHWPLIDWISRNFSMYDAQSQGASAARGKQLWHVGSMGSALRALRGSRCLWNECRLCCEMHLGQRIFAACAFFHAKTHRTSHIKVTWHSHFVSLYPRHSLGQSENRAFALRQTAWQGDEHGYHKSAKEEHFRVRQGKARRQPQTNHRDWIKLCGAGCPRTVGKSLVRSTWGICWPMQSDSFPPAWLTWVFQSVDILNLWKHSQKV